MKQETIAGLLIAAYAAMLLFSCSRLKSQSDEKYFLPLLEINDPAPKHVVIMPFINKTSKDNLDVEVRRIFYNYFSSKNYYDFELCEIDNSLKMIEKLYSRSWKHIPPDEIGKFFNADFVICGEVMDFKKLYLGVYSQIALKVKIKMIRTQSGKTAWTETILKRTHQGDLPLNPFSLFSTSVRCGLQMKKEKTDDLINHVCMSLAAHIPEPSASHTSAWGVDIQIGSFSDKNKAVKLVWELQKEGFPARLQIVRLKKKDWYRVLLGPYRHSEAMDAKSLLAKKRRFTPILIHHNSVRAKIRNN